MTADASGDDASYDAPSTPKRQVSIEGYVTPSAPPSSGPIIVSKTSAISVAPPVITRQLVLIDDDDDDDGEESVTVPVSGLSSRRPLSPIHEISVVNRSASDIAAAAAKKRSFSALPPSRPVPPAKLSASATAVADGDGDDDDDVDLLAVDDASVRSTVLSQSQSQPQSQSSKSARSRAYVPRARSGAWAALLVMNGRSWLTKAQIVAAVTDSALCNGAFSWRSVMDLTERGFIESCSATNRFALTATGVAMAARLAAAAKLPAPQSSQAQPIAAAAAPVQASQASQAAPPPPLSQSQSQVPNALADVDISGGRVLLLIDTRELTHHPRLGMLLATRGVPFESRVLTLSDMLFVMSVPRADAAPLELVMDFAAERKELPDFMSSFSDGRYQEQKHRLARCGVNNVCYLVEGRLTASITMTSSGWDHRTQRYARYARTVPTEAIRSAMLSTTIHDKFIVRHTETLDETADYLACVYRYLVRVRKMVELPSDDGAKRYVSLTEFKVDNTKAGHLSVRDLFAIQLMQVRGCSASRAAAIVALYPTAMALHAAYARLDNDVQRSRMLADLLPADAAMRLGPQLSAEIFNMFR